ncbi:MULTISPECIES: FAD-binding and (Fe-S)-binding domain-containing protein [unclassified Sphingobacterium]|uniref:FAD-binding and (Fe-S)-binding domain-containing protein n=1 Tax=unclassified Sphingobacterium TaxID=2609468 RepID=UPI0010474433|nr:MULTISPECIES: FAD-binding and (Fe-S)-binding domain-containing protein [unclassified Sphingobacterium]MCS3556170.1 FAD/FMN-containing dehydrogenase/Fe-S oxidoreductase [Sphingobacterium sp. JUb21]TCR08546.1 FAD/FMN-containing dehydrogenase [Sphingobacterium sp. JUb20]
MKEKLTRLAAQLEGDCYTDQAMRILYATDASAYSEMPLAVVLPRSLDDLKKLVAFAAAAGTSLIPRAAGTSLAGQVVGDGIVVDVSKYLNQIIEVNVEERWVKVQPGVVRDELNLFLKPYGLFFGPETSTANRATLGGMVGNNSCGSNSIVYKSTREHTLAIKGLLSDGSEAQFNAIDFDTFIEKCNGETLESKLYLSIRRLLGNYENQQEIIKNFPKKSIQRRNTGYAIDLLLESEPFIADKEKFNFCKLICGSEGTLVLITEITLNLELLPPIHSGLLCVHFHSLEEALQANLVALKYKPHAVELIDHYILACTLNNMDQQLNRFFISGNPTALLVIEYVSDQKEEVIARAAMVEAEMRFLGLGYHFPLLFGEDTKKVWSLRKAGLGLLSNLPGDEKAVPVIEDTAVDVTDLPAYIHDFNQILKKHDLHSVHYAHAGSGELHLRPILNLKTAEGHAKFRLIAAEIAALVKRYQGSLSGEHGDGRLRGEFLEQMVGSKNYKLLKEVKETWDPNHIFNPGKIIDCPPMDAMLRYQAGQKTPAFKTIFRYPGQDILQHVEQCNGSGDCRKSQLSGGTMCPSYMATRNEKDTTRARANILRNFLTHSDKENRFDHPEIKDILDLCISCKGCKSECPSSVDMAKVKAEFLQQYQDANGIPLRSWLIARFSTLAKIGSILPAVYNFMMQSKRTSLLFKKMVGFAVERSMPEMHAYTLRKWFFNRGKSVKSTSINQIEQKTVYFFCDEFTNYQDVPIGMKAILLLESLGYYVIIPEHQESGRACISKGLLRKAKRIAHQNVISLVQLISDQTPLIGIEPSAILTFRDEYPDLVDDHLLQDAKKLSRHVFMIDEFLAAEMQKGRIEKSKFKKDKKHIKLHGHCQQKAWSALKCSEEILSFPENYTVEIIPSGCCGMAGSFGYEKEHYKISMEIGELVLFPEIRKQPSDILISATGTSCRHQIKDGTAKIALHPVEILYSALRI